VATLGEVLADPTILQQLTEEGDEYPVSEEDLRRIVALIDAPLPWLTQKMWTLQAALPAKYKLVLTVTPSRLGQELRRIPGITNVGIWALPYDALEYRNTHRLEQAFVLRLDAWVHPFAGDNALANGRRQHIRGVFSQEPPLKGAKQYYLDCRIPDAALSNLTFTDDVKAVLGIEGALPDDPAFLQPFRTAQTARLKFFKRHASYYLGLIALEEGKYDVAVDYLRTRTLEADPKGKFTDGARYALARCLEQSGRLQGQPQRLRQALEILESDQSPQATGNHLRAAQLRRELGES
jgi:tetratricopeptide (TPR) repeat protein